MTLDVLDFIEEKRGFPALIKDSQRKRGLSGEIVDEVIELYRAWVKSKYMHHDLALIAFKSP